MTAPSLKADFSKFGAYFAYKLRSLRTLVVLNGIFALFSYPAVMLVLLPYWNAEIRIDEAHYEYGKPEYMELLERRDALESLLVFAAIIGVLMLAAMFIMNYVMPGKTFRWLYRKSAVDMDYSLPVSDDTRFFGDLLASLTGSLVPHLAAIAVGSGLYWLLPFERGGFTAEMTGELFRSALQLAFTGVAACIMLMAVTLLVMSLCGRVVEARIMPLVVNIVIPVIHVVCVVMLVRGMRNYGYNSNYEFTGIGATSPLGLLAITLMTVINGSTDVDFVAAMFRPEILVPLVIVTVGCFAAAYILIRQRRAERVGSPFVYPAVKTVLMGAVTFMIISLFMMFCLPENGVITSADFSELVGPYAAMVVITFIVFVIMELISGKGFEKFHRTLLRYVITAVLSVAVCVGIYLTHGMGFERAVPDAKDIAEVRVTLVDYTPEGVNIRLWNVEIILPEEIENVIRIHKEENISCSRLETGYRFGVQYNLNGGNVLHREFALSEEDFYRVLDSVLTPDVWYRENHGTILELYGDSNGVIDDDAVITAIGSANGVCGLNIPLAELMDAVRLDSEQVSSDVLREGYIDGEAGLRIVVPGSDGVSDNQMWLSVWSWQKNTIALLERYGAGELFSADSTTRAMAIRVNASALYENGFMNARTILLGNIDATERADRPDIYHGDFSCVMNGSDEAVPGGSFEMAEASAYMYDWLHYAELTEPERNYSSDFIYMVLTVDASELNDGTAEISLEDTVLYVPDIAAESIDWLFSEMKS